MSMGDSVIFGMLGEKMSWLGQRQRVLSQNIANADTPDYRSRDIAKLDFNDAMARQKQQVSLSVSEPQHVTLPESSRRFGEGEAESVYETSITGNSVVLEEQMMMLSQTSGDYSMATGIYRKYMALHRAALGRQN